MQSLYNTSKSCGVIMKSVWGAFLGLYFMSSLALANGFEPYNDDLVWTKSDMLPQKERWQNMYLEAQDIAQDLSSGGGRYSLIYKQKGGSSHQALVIRNADNKTMGIWSAPNHATYIEGEIFAFNVARLLNRSEWSTPAVRLTLVGPGREQALKAMEAQAPKARSCNRAHILNYMNANPHYVIGVYKQFEDGIKPIDIPELVDRVDQKRLNIKHPIVRMIMRDGELPQGRPVYLSSKKTLSYSDQNAIAISTDIELAKQLSALALVDALTSQRDRFGPYGSNMEAMLNSQEKSFAITMVDNGGSAESANTVSLKYFIGSPGRPGVSRFEREVFDAVLELDDFLKGKRSRFLDYHSILELKKALGHEDYPSTVGHIPVPGCGNHTFLFGAWKRRWDIRWGAFVKAVDLVSAHMRKYQNDPQAFFEEYPINIQKY
jgi:hypothetical protein